MNIRRFFLSTIILFLLSSFVYASQYKTEVVCGQGVVSVENKATGKQAILTSGLSIEVTKDTITAPKKAVIVDEFKDEIKKEKSEKAAEIKSVSAEDIAAAKKVVEDFAKAATAGDFAKLDNILSPDFMDNQGRNKSTYFECLRVFLNTMKTSGRPATISIISLVPSGVNSYKGDFEKEFYFGQKQYRYLAKGIAIQISPEHKILRFSGAYDLLNLPDVLNQEIVLEKDCYYNGVLQNTPIVLNANTASLGGNPVFITGTATIRKNHDSFDIDTATVKVNDISSGDFIDSITFAAPNCSTIGSALMNPNVVAASLTNISGLNFISTSGLAAVLINVGDVYVLKSKQNRASKITITNTVAATSITFQYKINPIAGDNSI